MTIHTKVNNLWLNDGKPFVKVNGEWREVEFGYSKKNGVWEIFYQKPRNEIELEFMGDPNEIKIPNATSLTLINKETEETKVITNIVGDDLVIPESELAGYRKVIIRDLKHILSPTNLDKPLLLNDQTNLTKIVNLGRFPFDRLTFAYCTNLIAVPPQIPKTVRSLYSCFRDCVNFNDPNVGTWDVSNANGLNGGWGIFYNATSFNQPLPNWDTSRMSNVSFMFRGAASFNQDVSHFRFDGTTSIQGMFTSATSFNQPLNTWDVSHVGSLRELFYNATSFNQDISNWDTSKVRNMDYMFYGTSSFNQDLSGWCVAKISTKPNRFDTDAPNWIKEDRLPVWGTCPRGEDQN